MKPPSVRGASPTVPSAVRPSSQRLPGRWPRHSRVTKGLPEAWGPTLRILHLVPLRFGFSMLWVCARPTVPSGVRPSSPRRPTSGGGLELAQAPWALRKVPVARGLATGRRAADRRRSRRRPPPLHRRTGPPSPHSSPRKALPPNSHGSRFVPQTAPDGRPPALMVARRTARGCFAAMTQVSNTAAFPVRPLLKSALA